jgi:hypothetical protein
MGANIIADAITGIMNGLSGAGDAAVKIRTAVTGKDPAIEGQVEILQQQLEAAKQAAGAASDAAQSGYWTATLGVTGSNFFKFFVAGPKPALFWVCVFAFALQFGVQPVINWIIASIAAIAGVAHPFQLAAIDMSLPTQLLVGGMGLGSAVVRGIEKINGAQGNH